MLDGHVLVLNRLYQPIQVTSIRRAITLFYKGDARAVDSDYVTYDFENWADLPHQPDQSFIVTPTRNIPIPDVVDAATVAAIHFGFTPTLVGGAVLYALAGTCGWRAAALAAASPADPADPPAGD